MGGTLTFYVIYFIFILIILLTIELLFYYFYLIFIFNRMNMMALHILAGGIEYIKLIAFTDPRFDSVYKLISLIHSYI